jgi:hypothetical protein
MPQIDFSNSYQSTADLFREGDNIRVRTNLYESEYDDLDKGLFWRIIGEGADAQFSSTFGYINRSTSELSIDALYNRFENDSIAGSGRFYDLEFARDRFFRDKVESLEFLVMDSKPPGERYFTLALDKKRLTEGEPFSMHLDYRLFESSNSYVPYWAYPGSSYESFKVGRVYYRIEGEGAIDVSDFDYTYSLDGDEELFVGSDSILSWSTIGYRATNDQKQEGSERFRFVLYEDQNFTLPIASSNWVEINDSGAEYSKSYYGLKSIERHGDYLFLSVIREGSSTQRHEIQINTENGSATSGVDFRLRSGGLIFESGEVEKRVSIYAPKNETAASDGNDRFFYVYPTISRNFIEDYGQVMASSIDFGDAWQAAAIHIDQYSDLGELAIQPPEEFTKNSADLITNFNPTTDSIKIDAIGFDLEESPSFASAASKKIFKRYVKSDIDFIYEQAKGGLYFNENGIENGFGDGGIFAMIKDRPVIQSGNLDFI